MDERERAIRARVQKSTTDWSAERHAWCPECRGLNPVATCSSCHGTGRLLTLYAGRNDEHHGLNLVSFQDWDFRHIETLELIVHAPDDLRYLLDLIDKLRAGVRE